jgi:hypothetical protein
VEEVWRRGVVAGLRWGQARLDKRGAVVFLVLLWAAVCLVFGERWLLTGVEVQVVGECSRRVCGRGIRSALDGFMAAELSIYRQSQAGAAAAGLVWVRCLCFASIPGTF